MHQNGVFKGFDLQTVPVGTNPNDNQIYLRGGSALVGGKIVYKNSETVEIPKIQEYYSSGSYGINWAVCVNDKNEYQPIPLLDYDSVNLTPNADRIFVARNPLNLLTYNLDAAYFSDIVNNRKDLTLLYVVYSEVVVSVGVATSTLTVRDVRKYALDVEANLPLKYNAGENQGNFKSISAIFNWLNYNGSFNGNVVIKGAETSLAYPYGPEISENLVIGTGDGAIVVDGENNSNLHFTGTIKFGSNVTFKNINLRFTNSVTFDVPSDNITFDNCNITISPSVSPANLIMFDLSSSSNITFKDCVITSVHPVQASDGGSVFRFSSCSNMKFLNATILSTYNVAAGTNYPGNIFTFVNSPNIVIEDSYFSGNYNSCIQLDASSDNLRFRNSTVISTYDPQLDTGVYDSSNLINSGYGYIQATINRSQVLEDIIIDNVAFDYAPTVASSDRFSFINFELTAYNATLKNVKITGCKFNNLNVGTTEDNRCAVSIINTSVQDDIEDQPQPLVSDVLIYNNTCNRSQSFVITSKTWSDRMVYPGLMAINCSISNNTVGTIGYWICSGSKFANTPPTYNPNEFNSKAAGLTISNNTCYYVATQDHLGKYFVTSERVAGVSTAMCDYPSGFVTIKDNKSSWIHVGIAYEDNSKLTIADNHLSAYFDSYLTPYGELDHGTSDGEYYGSNFAIFVNANPYVDPSITTGTPLNGNNSCCVISGNVIGSGYWHIPTLNVYKYDRGGIYCKSSATIQNNIIKGINSSSTTSRLIAYGGLNTIIINNQLYRESSYVVNYIGFINSDSTAWDGTGSSGIITENYLDSPYRTGSVSSTDVIHVPANAYFNWISERNINQTITRKLRISAARHLCDGGIGTPYDGSFWTLSAGFVPKYIDEYYNECEIGYAGGSGSLNYTVIFELTHIIPANVKLVSVSEDTSADTSAAGTITCYLDVKNETSLITQSTAASAHNYPINTSSYTFVHGLSDYINDINGSLIIQIRASFSSANSMMLQLSPVEITYRW